MSARWWLMGLTTLCVAAACGDRPSRSDAPRSVAAASTVTIDGAIAICDSVATEWRRRDPSASVRQTADTLISEQDNGFVYKSAPEHRACLTIARDEHYRGGPAEIVPAYGARPIWRPGWTEIDTMSADGPGGGEQGYMRGDVRCLVWVEFDGEDDSDSTYVPADWFVETTMCWLDRQPAKR